MRHNVVCLSVTVGLCLKKWIGSAHPGTRRYSFQLPALPRALKLSTAKISNAIRSATSATAGLRVLWT